MVVGYNCRVIDDIYNLTRDLPTSFGGKWQISSYMYTEIIWWGKQMSATPDGRYNGDYLSQGLTPSRITEIKSTTTVFDSLRYYDYTKLSCGSVINVILPAAKMNIDILNDFLRGCANAKAHVIQLNSVDREQLLKAQKDPERYKHIIVRVCGFSAPFVSLSEEFQKEFLSRNYYEM
jgi:formate C-acetyltransferase